MKAITLEPENLRVGVKEMPDPMIQGVTEVKLKILEVGICGTDREEASGQRGSPPPGEKELILGHEMLGKVVEVGSAVSKVKVGDLAVFTVRRGCGKCPACQKDRYDMCYTGDYTERGIKGRHGFQSQFVVDEEKHLIPISGDMLSFAVLSEPTSVVEKAIDQILCLQRARLPDWAEKGEDLTGRTALVAGLGPIGLLAAIVFRLRGASVIGMDIVDPNSLRPQLLEKIGGRYFDGKTCQLSHLKDSCASIDLILEAAGVPALDFQLLEALGINGGYVLTGVAADHKMVNIDGGTMMERLVMNNQVILGSVNAADIHWAKGADDLKQAGQKWGDVLSSLITQRIPYEHFEEALNAHIANEIKSVITWN